MPSATATSAAPSGRSDGDADGAEPEPVAVEYRVDKGRDDVGRWTPLGDGVAQLPLLAGLVDDGEPVGGSLEAGALGRLPVGSSPVSLANVLVRLLRGLGPPSAHVRPLPTLPCPAHQGAVGPGALLECLPRLRSREPTLLDELGPPTPVCRSAVLAERHTAGQGG